MLRMRMVKYCRIPLGMLLAGTFLGAQEIALYLEPGATEPAGVTAKAEEIAAIAQPAEGKDLPAGGWFWAQWKDSYTGYTGLEQIKKDLTVKPGAVIRQRPGDIAPILTIVQEGDETELLQGGDWAKVRFVKPLPVYFQLPQQLRPGDKPPEPATAAPAPSAPPPAAAQEKPPPPKTAEKPLPRLLEGILEESKAIYGPGRGHPLKLVNARGKTIAFVDIARLKPNNPLSFYLNAEVIIRGEVSREKGALIINARHIRHK